MANWIQHPSGITIPQPAYGSGLITLATLVDGGRNQNGKFIGQVIGDDKLKVEITFAALKPEEVKIFLSLFDRRVGGKFAQTFTVYDPVLMDYRDCLMYVGDRTMRPFNLNVLTGHPEWFLNIKANLIEV